MKNYANENIEFDGCPGCAYANHEFILPCGMIYENERLTLSQDWELPIPGFIIISPKKCVDKFEDLLNEERIEIFDIIDKTIKALRKNDICDRFNVIFEEKENVHSHVWIVPRYDWMIKLFGNPTKNINQIFEYAKNNMRTLENFDKIKEITDIVKKSLKIYCRSD